MQRRRLLKSINLISSTNYSWIDLRVSPLELRPCFTLVTGQSFGWKQLENHEIWIGVIKNYPVAIKQTSESVFYTHLLNNEDNDQNGSNNLPIEKNNPIEEDLNQTILEYFQSEVCLVDLYQMVLENDFIIFYSLSLS